MFAKAGKKRLHHTESLIGVGTVVTGDIRFCGGLRIDGEVMGKLRSVDGKPGALVIGEKGRVEGDIEATRLVVNGLVRGRIDVTELIKFQSRARVSCDVDYGAAEIHLGAVIQGRLLQHAARGEQPQEYDVVPPATPLAAATV